MDWLQFLLQVLGQGQGGPGGGPPNTMPPPGGVGPHDYPVGATGMAPAAGLGMGRLRTQGAVTRYGRACPPEGPPDPRSGGYSGPSLSF